MKKQSLTIYQIRNRLCKELGYRNYSTYLRSPLWKKTRLRIWAIYHGQCCMCRGPGQQVHHLKYDEATLLGNNLRGLILLCSLCHYGIEFNNGVKVSGREARTRFYDKAIRTSITQESKSIWEIGEVDLEYREMFRD